MNNTGKVVGRVRLGTFVVACSAAMLAGSMATPASASTLDAASLSAATPTLAQARGDEDGSRTRYSRRGSKRIVKIAIFGGIALLGAGGWAIRKMRGE